MPCAARGVSSSLSRQVRQQQLEFDAAVRLHLTPRETKDYAAQLAEAAAVAAMAAAAEEEGAERRPARGEEDDTDAGARAARDAPRGASTRQAPPVGATRHVHFAADDGVAPSARRRAARKRIVDTGYQQFAWRWDADARDWGGVAEAERWPVPCAVFTRLPSG